MYLGNKSCHQLARQLLFHELGIHTETAKPAAEPPQRLHLLLRGTVGSSGDGSSNTTKAGGPGGRAGAGRSSRWQQPLWQCQQ